MPDRTAYKRPNSRDPRIAISAGQWMTERPGGSDGQYPPLSTYVYRVPDLRQQKYPSPKQAPDRLTHQKRKINPAHLIY